MNEFKNKVNEELDSALLNAWNSLRAAFKAAKAANETQKAAHLERLAKDLFTNC